MATPETPATRSQAIEDYAKAIYALELRDSEAVSTNALAERLGVTSASASGMVKRLGELGPHGDPIPTRELTIEEGSSQSLQSLEAGAAGTFVRVSDSDGPRFVRFGDRVQVLGGALAKAMRVEVSR
jgi:Iron dependent repressor, N-terminal DNA binding domain